MIWDDMLALFASPIARDAMIAVFIAILLAAGFGYYKYSQAEMTALENKVAVVQQQASDLTAAKSALEKQIADIAAAENAANASITKAQTDATTAMTAVRTAQAAFAPKQKPIHVLWKNQLTSHRIQLVKSLMELTQ